MSNPVTCGGRGRGRGRQGEGGHSSRQEDGQAGIGMCWWYQHVLASACVGISMGVAGFGEAVGQSRPTGDLWGSRPKMGAAGQRGCKAPGGP